MGRGPQCCVPSKGGWTAILLLLAAHLASGPAGEGRGDPHIHSCEAEVGAAIFLEGGGEGGCLGVGLPVCPSFLYWGGRGKAAWVAAT